MATRYIVSAPTLAALRQQLTRIPPGGPAAIGFREDTQAVYIVDPATGQEIVLGTFSGDPEDVSVAEDEIIVGQADGKGASVAMSGDATIDATGAVTVLGFAGSPVPTADPQDGETIWNDNGVLKVASSA